MCAALLLPLATAARGDAGESDYILKPVPGATAAPAPPPFLPEFQFTFGAPARWPGKLMRWRYNHNNAVEPFLSDKAGTLQRIIGNSSKWSAVCGIQFVYDGETAVSPNTVVNDQPDNLNVVGWGSLDPGTSGLTYSWYEALTDGSRWVVDSDIFLSLVHVNSAVQMDRTGTHEWGHAIGVGHSNLAGAVMSGLPDSPYSGLVDLAPDDVRACRCLYGAATGQQAAYVCSLPSSVDFGPQTVGVNSAARRVNVTNDTTATAALTVYSATIASGEFLVSGIGCAANVALAPGAGCTFDFVARPGVVGTRIAEAVISTSDGPYRLPLRADGVGAPPPPPTVNNYQGLWWKAPAGSESGWGINFAHQGDTIFATWFTYDITGNAWWLTMTANKIANNAYSGTLYETRGPALNAVPFLPNATIPTAVGPGTLTFADANNGTFAYTVNGTQQSKAITREAFGPLPGCTFGTQPNLALATNYQDLWWAAPAGAESGWGINFTHQGDTLFATWFTYDLNGVPLWLVVTAPKTGTGVYSGTLFRTMGPTFNAFDTTKVVAIPSGTATFTFADGNNATFAYTVTGVAPAPVVQTKQITRQVFRMPGTVCQ